MNMDRGLYAKDLVDTDVDERLRNKFPPTSSVRFL